MTTNFLTGKNIKLVAKGFNPPLFTEYWLKKEKFIPDECEISPPPISTPQFTQISSKKFNLLVLPDQLQFSITDDPKIGIGFFKTLTEKIHSLSFMAMGFNFDYFVPDKEIKHGFFFVPQNKLFQEFKVRDAKYGAFLTKNFENSRLSLSVKPVKAKDPQGVESNVYHYNLNYHFELTKGDGKAIITSSITNWKKYFSYSEKLMKL